MRRSRQPLTMPLASAKNLENMFAVAPQCCRFPQASGPGALHVRSLIGCRLTTSASEHRTSKARKPPNGSGLLLCTTCQVDDDMTTETAATTPARTLADLAEIVRSLAARPDDWMNRVQLRCERALVRVRRTRSGPRCLVDQLAARAGDRIPRSWRVIGSVRRGPRHARGTSSRR